MLCFSYTQEFIINHLEGLGFKNAADDLNDFTSGFYNTLTAADVFKITASKINYLTELTENKYMSRELLEKAGYSSEVVDKESVFVIIMAKIMFGNYESLDKLKLSLRKEWNLLDRLAEVNLGETEISIGFEEILDGTNTD